MSTTFEYTFGQLVENARKGRKMTQQELAQILEVSRATISRLEQGEHSISLLLAVKLAQTLQFSLDDCLKKDSSVLESFIEEHFTDNKNDILKAISAAKIRKENNA